MVGLANEGKKVDVVFMDPPRSGSDEAFMSHAANTAELVSFTIQKEESSSAGVRRIKAVIGA